jgi:hypothetical protein
MITHQKTLIRYGILLALLFIQSCNTAVIATPTLELSSPNPPTPTLEQPSFVPTTPTITLTTTPENLEPRLAFEPPVGFKPYQDPVVGVSVFVPENWVVTLVIPGQSAIFQSYPEDKYIGGEGFFPGDTKCDLTIRPPEIDVASHIQEIKSYTTDTIISEGETILQSGEPGIRLEVESRGRSLSMITEVNERTVVLTCFGELAPFDEVAVTIFEIPKWTTSVASDPPAGFKLYQDEVAGVSVFVPDRWIWTHVFPGQSAILQSYPEGKYIGGEAFQPLDTKCDLTIHPPDIDIASYIQQLKSDPTVTIISEGEIILLSSQPGTRLEVDSRGPSNSLVTEVNERVVVLTCFGDLAPFDEISITLSASE